MEKKAIDFTSLKHRDEVELGIYHKPTLYFAGPWFDEEAKSIMDYAEWLQDKLVKQGINKYNVYFPRRHNCKTPYETFLSNISTIEDIDAMIALVSSKDVGTAYELGFANGGWNNIPITLLGIDEDTFKSKTNIMLAFCTDAYIGIKDLYNFLTGKPVERYKMTNTWEDKE